MTTAAATPGRGRPRQFDPDVALDRVLQVFWEKGYEATSVSDLVAATGLNKSSIYNEFGSKDALYERALERYMRARMAVIDEVVAQGSRGLDDIATLLAFMREEVTTSDVGRLGCFAVNDATEFGSTSDRAAQSSRKWRDGIRAAVTAALSRAEDRGEIAPGSAAIYADVFVPWMLGMSVVARGGADDDEVESLFDAAEALLGEIRSG